MTRLSSVPLAGRSVKHALMIDLDDVGGVLAQHAGDAASSPGLSGMSSVRRDIRPARASSRVSTLCEQPRVDVAAGEHETDLLPAKRCGSAMTAAKAGRARAFDHGLLDQRSARPRALDMRFADEHDIVDVATHDACG